MTLHRVVVKALHPDAIMPARAHPADAGLDLCALEGRALAPGARHTFETGVAFDIPPGYVGLVCPRSGLAAREGITVLNAPGVIDAGYHGDVSVVLVNQDSKVHVIPSGTRIAQLVIVPIETPSLITVGELGREDFPSHDDVDRIVRQRGINGFGSTGQ